MAGESWITDELRATIGKITRSSTGIATKAQIKRFAQAVGDCNPLYTNQEYAQKSIHGGLIAPPLFDGDCLDYGGAETEYDILPNGSRGGQPGQDVPLPKELIETLDGGSEYSIYRRIHAGDEITSTWKIVDIYEKVGKRGGRLLFIVYEATLTNQNDETVMICRGTLIKSKRT